MPKTIGPRAKILECRAQSECRVNAPRIKRAVPKTIGPRAKILECRAQSECRLNAPLFTSH